MELYERIRDLLNDKVAEIFTELQKEYDIEYEDCPPDLEWDLSNSIDDLAETIKTAVKIQM